jgi:hypothetical protein
LTSGSGPRRDGDDLAFRAGVAEERGDVVAHLGEGLAAELPGLVEVIDQFEAGAPAADGKLGNLRSDADLAHQRAAGAAQVVRRELDARGALLVGECLAPIVEGASGFLRSKHERACRHRLRGDDGAHQVGHRHVVSFAGLGTPPLGL